MIYGIGTDIADSKRIAKALQRHPERFAEKLLSEAEMPLFAAAKNPVNFLAKRWAAKEAFAKACGTGIRYPVLFPSISIDKDTLGKPCIRPHHVLCDWLAERGLTHFHLSLSDENGLILAFVVIESENTQ